MTESREREVPARSAESLPPGAAAPPNGSDPELGQAAAPPSSLPSPEGTPEVEPASGPEGEHDEDEDDEDEESQESARENRAQHSTSPEAAGAGLPEASQLWGSASRSVVLAGVIGFAVATWLQLAIGARWASDLLAKNILPTGTRMAIIKASVAGGVLAALVAGYLIWAELRKRRDPAPIERWLWFLSPLILLPAVGWVFRAKPWINEHARLLPIVLFLSIVLEVLVFRALQNVPERALEWVAELKSQVPEKLQRHGPLAVVALGAVFYVGFFSFFLLRWHYKLRTGNFDLSINTNLMYGGLHGRFLESPVVFPQDPPKYLANHAKFGGYLFLPIYALFPRPETLLVIQSTLIGASALPLFGFARRHLSEWAAALVALAYLLYYPMHGASFSEFQYVPIAGFFVLTTVWAAETRRWVVFWIAFATGILMREDAPIGMAVVGLFLVLTGYRPVQGLIMALISVTYFCVLRFYVMEEAGQWWFPNMYKELWADGEKGFKSVVKTLLSNPLFVFSKVVVEKKLIYLLHLLVPLAFLPARRWYLWAAFLPGAILTLLVTNYDPPITFSFHYVMHWTPYLFLASVLALEALGKEPLFGVEHRRAALTAMCAATLALTYNYGAFPMRNGSFRGGFQKVDFSLKEEEKVRYEQLQTLIAKIPPDARVAATEKLGPHVSSRVIMYTMRHGPQGAEWALASSRDLKLSRTRPKLYEALDTGEYGVVERLGDLALLKKGHETSGNAKLIRDWRLASDDKRRQDRRKEPEVKEPEAKEPEPEGEPEPHPPEAGPG